MKKIFLIQLLFPLAIYAQEKNLADTIVTKDPLNMRREYWIIHKPNGDIGEQGFMLDGKKDGSWRIYEYGSSVVSRIQEYSGGVKNGASIALTSTGTITLDETYLNDKLEGPRMTMTTYGGRIRTIEHYKNGLLDGNKKSYYENTKVQEDGDWKNGKRNGVTTWYRSDGTPSLEYTYLNGSIQGASKEYSERGHIKKEGNFDNDNEYGEWKEYRDTTISARDTFLLVKKIFYKGGQIVKEVPVKE